METGNDFIRWIFVGFIHRRDNCWLEPGGIRANVFEPSVPIDDCVKFLGHKVSLKRIKPGDDKVVAIRRFPAYQLILKKSVGFVQN